jgi:hypothetical protein
MQVLFRKTCEELLCLLENDSGLSFPDILNVVYSNHTANSRSIALTMTRRSNERT